MAFVTPAEIAAKAERAYPRFLAKWIRGEAEDFFPLRIPANLQLDRKQPQAAIAANEILLAKSKACRGWGYSVQRRQVASQDFGNNAFPTAITIDTLDDLLRLANTQRAFAATSEVAEKVRQQLPPLQPWLHKSVKSLAGMRDACDGLILVAQFFMEHPELDCYARQIPVRVDTKFIQRHQKMLRQWLDLLLPDSAIDVNEQNFNRRFGLRDSESHHGLRLLDPQLPGELGLPFDEFSLPLRSLAQLSVHDATIFIVENDLNLLTLPPYSRGLAIRGAGNAVNRLERLEWLHSNRVLYWGDLDVAGLVILSRLRNLLPHVESMLMDLETLAAHRACLGTAHQTLPTTPPTNLNPSEHTALQHCLLTGEQLEQEKILQTYVDRALADLAYSSL